VDVLATENQYSPRNAAQTQGGSWRVYLRLVRYAWNYKLRLAVSLLFAVVVAVSFGSMIFTTGGVVRVIFGKEEVMRFNAKNDDTPKLLQYMATQPLFAGAPTVNEGADFTEFSVPLNPDSLHTLARVRGELAGLGARQVETFPEQVNAAIQHVQAFTTTMKERHGWALEGLNQTFRDVVARMRAHRMVALAILSGALVALTLIAGVARFLQEYFAGSIGANITIRLIQEMYENVVDQSLAFFERRPTGELLARFTNDVFMVNRGLASVFVKLLREPFKVLVFLILAIRVDPLLTIVGLGVLPPVGYVIVRIGKQVKKNVRRSLERVANVAAVAKETFTGISIVKSFGMERHQVARVREELTKLRKYIMRTLKADAAVGPLAEFVMVLGVVAFILLSGQRVEAGLMDSGDLVVLYFSLAGMLDPMRKLASVNNAIQTSVASAERVFEFIDAKPDLVEAPDAVDLPRLEEALRFEDVHFTYPGQEKEAIRGVTFEVPKGHMVALVGFSGGGKTTLAKLVPRFYDPTSGAVTLDGIDLRKATFRSLRDQIGTVTQETILFDETIRETIACGHAEYTKERLRKAARIAQAVEFIGKLPQGYDTRIGEAGNTLSGGERQRLAIARALARDPAILILDEATSSLDSESERAIQQAIEESIVGRTTIVIAHRLSTILRADQILVLDDGRIVERGTHHELLERGGLYSRLYEVQFESAAET